MINNFDDMNRMFEQMDRTFDQMRDGWTDRRDSNANLIEEDGEYVFVMDLPGFETEEIDLVYKDGHLQISAVAERSEESELTSMRHSRSTNETVTIPDEIDVDEIDASYHNGVLEVRLPMLTAALDDGHDIDIR